MESDPIREINGLNWETLDLNIQKFLIIYVASGVLSDYDFNIRMISVGSSRVAGYNLSLQTLLLYLS